MLLAIGAPPPFIAVYSYESPFHYELRELAAREQLSPPPGNPILFFGSSSIRLWESLKADFEGLPVVNHGFGGSTLNDCLHEVDRLVTPLSPAAIMIYAGDNDLDQKASPDHVVWLFEQLAGAIRAGCGSVPIGYISVKPSPARFWNIANIRRANELLSAACNRLGVDFLDLSSEMVNADGQPRRELYSGDGLHMSGAGYAIWAGRVRDWLRKHGFLR